MYDAALDLLPPTSMTGSPAAGSAKLLGKNRTYRAWGRCGGDATAGATATFTFEEGATSTGPWTDLPGAPSLVVTEQMGGTADPEIPSSVIPLPSVVLQTTKDYVRHKAVVLGGTTPTLPACSIKLEPLDAPSVPSGR